MRSTYYGKCYFRRIDLLSTNHHSLGVVAVELKRLVHVKAPTSLLEAYYSEHFLMITDTARLCHFSLFFSWKIYMQFMIKGLYYCC